METRLPDPNTPATAWNLGVEIRKVEGVRKALEQGQSLTNRQSAALNKAIELLGESKKGGRSDRYQTRRLLLAIYKRFDIDVLFLCSTALSITRLGDVKRNASLFFPGLSEWRSSVMIPEEVHGMATESFTTVLSEIGADELDEIQDLDAETMNGDKKAKPKQVVKKKSTTSVKRKRTSMDEQPAKDSSGCPGWPRKESAYDFEESVNVHIESTTKGEGLVKEEPQTPSASNTTIPDFGALVDIPLYATVVKLDQMDVVRTLVFQEFPNCRLTIPDIPGARPFISFYCPMEFALAFKNNREHVQC